MKQHVTLAAISLMLVACLASPGAAGPPPPPGGHIPVYYGGANQAGYPPASSAVVDPRTAPVTPLQQVSSAPNPFRGMTLIRFTLGQDDEARLRVFDLSGRQVREIVHRAESAGLQQAQWDGRDEQGNPLGAGVYFYQLAAAGGRSVTRKLVLLH